MEHLRTVTSFEFGFTTSALRMSYVLARLSCGHRGSVTVKPNRGTCMTCGVERELPAGQVQYCCGRSAFTITFSPDHHNPDHFVTKVGDSVPCEACAAEAKQIAWLEALDPAIVHHGRFRHGSYHLYRLDHASPSNFVLIGSVMPSPAIEALLAKKGISPLSPTEPA